MMENEISLEKLLVYEQDLQHEEERLKKIVDKLDAQTRALKVEQLNILGAISKKMSATKETSCPQTEKSLKKEIVEHDKQELDLTVPRFESCEEDDEMEE